MVVSVFQTIFELDEKLINFEPRATFRKVPQILNRISTKVGVHRITCVLVHVKSLIYSYKGFKSAGIPKRSPGHVNHAIDVGTKIHKIFRTKQII